MSVGLNSAQKDAVDTLSGPLLVLAGAGSGKTRVVTYRIAKLIDSGIAPERILAVTFTNKAAQEMQHRVREQLKGGQNSKPEISTFHSLCVRILRRQIDVLGYPRSFSIVDAADQDTMARKVLREIRVHTSQLSPRELIYQISGWKSKCIRPEQAAQIADTDKQHVAAAGYRRYQSELKRMGSVDFDDLLLLTDDLFSAHSNALEEEAGRFDHLLIDEYQDTNAIQYRIVKALAAPHGNLCVVGDDDQSIYGFRGSEVEHILHFQDDWPKAKVVRLETNYRSTAAILETANTLISYNKSRLDKSLIAARPAGQKPRIEQFRDENVEAEQVVYAIQRQIESGHWEPSDFAILFRTNEQPRVFETELRKRNLPYVLVGSKSFFDRKEVRDLLAYLKTVLRPRDESSLRRILNTPARGISNKTMDVLVAEATDRGEAMWDVMQDAAFLKTALPVPARMAISNFIEMIGSLQTAFHSKCSLDAINALIEKSDYEKEVERASNTPEERDMRWNNVQELVNAFSGFLSKKREPTLLGFLDEVALNAADLESDKDKQLSKNAIALMTLHASKGLEFPICYMVGMEEGILPHRRSLEEDGDDVSEERRLAYVGVTRAQELLYLSLSLSRMKWGKSRETKPSRFLFEMIGMSDNPNKYDRSHPKKARGSGRHVRSDNT